MAHGNEEQSLKGFAEHIREEDVRLLAREVIRRLAVHSVDPPRQDRLSATETPRDETIIALAAALVIHSPEQAERMLRGLQDDGLTLQILYTRYLAPAAAQLGLEWDHDALSFVDVIRGTTRIYALMRMLRHRLPDPAIGREAPIYFASVPGETHDLGVAMARDLFRQKGWEVRALFGLSHEEIVEEVAEAETGLLGLSCSGTLTAPALARLVMAVRILRPDINIMVSGAVVDAAPDAVRAMAPDSMVSGMDEALVEAQRLLNPGPPIRPEASRDTS